MKVPVLAENQPDRCQNSKKIKQNSSKKVLTIKEMIKKFENSPKNVPKVDPKSAQVTVKLASLNQTLACSQILNCKKEDISRSEVCPEEAGFRDKFQFESSKNAKQQVPLDDKAEVNVSRSGKRKLGEEFVGVSKPSKGWRIRLKGDQQDS